VCEAAGVWRKLGMGGGGRMRTPLSLLRREIRVGGGKSLDKRKRKVGVSTREHSPVSRSRAC